MNTIGLDMLLVVSALCMIDCILSGRLFLFLNKKLKQKTRQTFVNDSAMFVAVLKKADENGDRAINEVGQVLKRTKSKYTILLQNNLVQEFSPDDLKVIYMNKIIGTMNLHYWEINDRVAGIKAGDNFKAIAKASPYPKGKKNEI